jgi:hypothetical protein
MSTVLEIENAIDRLKPAERAQIASWLARREAQDWDGQMDGEAADERESGQLKDWPPK